jgi:hypothetical protein
MKNSVTEHDRATVTEEQDRCAPSAPAAHELTPAQLELVAGMLGLGPCIGPNSKAIPACGGI